MRVDAVLFESKAYEENIMLTDMDEMHSRTEKFNKSSNIWMSRRYIDPVEHMPRQCLRDARWGPTPTKKMAVTQ
jgi:hypothetical protein